MLTSSIVIGAVEGVIIYSSGPFTTAISSGFSFGYSGTYSYYFYDVAPISSGVGATV
jgi:hypothetical protein